MDYEVLAIEAEIVKELLAGDDAGREPEVAVHAEGGAPLRCCLHRAVDGERVALLSYAPLRRWGSDPGPYDEQGPVFVHPEGCAGPSGDYPAELHEVPKVFRAYSARGRILGGRVVAPGEHEAALAEMFADDDVARIAVRSVGYGCFLFAVSRR